jgi:hypothetical protein
MEHAARGAFAAADFYAPGHALETLIEANFSETLCSVHFKISSTLEN